MSKSDNLGFNNLIITEIMGLFDEIKFGNTDNLPATDEVKELLRNRKIQTKDFDFPMQAVHKVTELGLFLRHGVEPASFDWEIYGYDLREDNNGTWHDFWLTFEKGYLKSIKHKSSKSINHSFNSLANNRT